MTALRNSPADAIETRVAQWKRDWHERSGGTRQLRVRWLLNPGSEPVRNVQLTERDGYLLDIRTFDDDNRSDILPAILIPPLVNAHTHLEFSALREPLQPPGPFPDWIRAVMDWRRTSNVDSQLSVQQGLEESNAAGVGLLGEIATSAEIPTFDSSRMSIVRFREVIGLRPERIQQQLTDAQRDLETPACRGLTRALSPHAPYTVHPDLLDGLVRLAKQHRVPVAMHLGETNEEIELLRTGEGQFADFLRRMDLFDRSVFPGGRTLMEFLDSLKSLPHVLAVHGNCFGAEETAFLARHRNITTVYCPRTHRYFGHSEHPFRRLISAGCRVVLGTDSRASNPDLSLWRELQLVATLAPDFAPGRLLEMATTQAAESLGQDVEPFTIKPGQELRPVLITGHADNRDVGQFIRDPFATPVRL